MVSMLRKKDNRRKTNEEIKNDKLQKIYLRVKIKMIFYFIGNQIKHQIEKKPVIFQYVIL